MTHKISIILKLKDFRIKIFLKDPILLGNFNFLYWIKLMAYSIIICWNKEHLKHQKIIIKTKEKSKNKYFFNKLIIKEI